MSFLGQEEQIRELQDRFKYLYIALTVGALLLFSRLVYLQIFNGDKMRQYSEENRIKKVKIAAPRGMVFDRNRTLLLDNRPAFDLEIIPQYLKESKRGNETLETLASLIKMKASDIRAQLEKMRGQPSFIPVKIKEDLSREEVALVEAWKIDMPGVQVQQEIKRTNLYGDVAAHLLGFIGEVSPTELTSLNKAGEVYKLGDSVGKFGIEQRLEEVLRGEDGEKLVEVDALGRIKLDRSKGRVLASELEKPATPGKNLILTIDQDLQMAAVKAFGDKAGAVVAINPKNGEILAMVSRPAFDPTAFSRGIPPALWANLINNENRPLRDKTIQDHYPPGSVFKIITAIAGLEEGVIDEHTVFNCPGKLQVGSKTFHCWQKNGHGSINVREAITKSCDVFFYKVAQRLKSVDDLAKWAFYLGLGRRTGIPLPREVPGLIPTEEWKMKRYNQPWNPGETLSVAIGQGYVLTTILQLANTYASVANGGTQYRPFFVKRIESNDGQVISESKPEPLDTHHLKPSTARAVRDGLYNVVNDRNGTAYSQRLPGMDFVGKTGTAQVINLSKDRVYAKCENMRYRERHHALFAGFAPADDPQIAVAVIAEHGCHGGTAAAPVARAIIDTYLRKLDPVKYSDAAIAARVEEDKEKAKREWLAKVKKAQAEKEAAAAAVDEDVPQTDNDTLPAAVPGAAGGD
ncbi:MAG: penicillin-binding protein 2 [Bdellovibrionales bacterium]|nr:penicillin-binding protein 2 [Bdellovibrionales bacterium]